ncbi:MAG: tyrosine-type recombinase/integrase [Hungatella sp.]|jgi:integrase|nr:tyrosine-type recombinase/integrase [Hungatella sp.]
MTKVRAMYGIGTTYKQGNSFVSQLSYTVEIDSESYTKRVTGSGKSESAAVRNRNKNAKIWEEKLRNSLKQKQEKENKEQETGSELTLNEVFDLNLTVKGATAQISTTDNYESYFEGYVRNGLGKKLINHITEEDLLEFYMDTRKNGRKRVQRDKHGDPINQKPLSISTINHIRFVLNNTFLYAKTKGIVEKNAHINIAPFKNGTAAMLDFDQEEIDVDSDDADALQRIIPVEDLERILNYAFEHSRFAGLYAWAVNSGMREGECFGLKRTLSLPDNGYIFVKKSLAYVKDRSGDAKKKLIPILKKPKNGKERKVPYNQSLRDIYAYQIDLIEREKQAAGKLYHDRGLLFADEYGDYLRPWRVLKDFQQILETLGMEKRRFHDLRHTFVSLLVKESQRAGEGISILEVSAIVGHRDPTVTLNVYGGLFPNATERAMKILDGCTHIIPSQLRDIEKERAV